ncbi:FAD-dependent oxidoreductase, partial [Acinetobacter baumannii]
SILKTFPDSLAKSAYETLTKMGVKILTGGHVSKIEVEGIHIGDIYIPSTNVFWAAGNKAAPILAKLGAEMDHAGRVKVKTDLSIEGF